MTIPLYQIDAFTSRLFGGNPAAICPLESWPDDATLQAIALENNLSETAFIVPQGEGYHLRWFTPALEVNLCGHATLATAHLILNKLEPGREQVAFETLSGTLTVRREGERLAMDFPAIPTEPGEVPAEVVAAVGGKPVETYRVREVHGARYFMLVYASEAEVRALTPDFGAMLKLNSNAIATAPGDGSDCASRFFGPASGVNEDPVTGSAHCTIAPHWAAKLGRDEVHARQVSARGGELFCQVAGERVVLAGDCAFYMAGEIEV
ncbi:MAG: PhzF family phenazine biosynthesis protein [Alphaproteobacteria bacterium]